MTKTITAEFEVTGWEPGEGPETQVEEGPALGRVTVRKTFRGALEGTSVAELLTAGGDQGRGYVASELFTGTIEGRKGSVVFQHGGLDDGVAPFTYGHIVPGTATGELAGLAGEITYAHDESGARVTLVLRDRVG